MTSLSSAILTPQSFNYSRVNPPTIFFHHCVIWPGSKICTSLLHSPLKALSSRCEERNTSTSRTARGGGVKGGEGVEGDDKVALTASLVKVDRQKTAGRDVGPNYSDQNYQPAKSKCNKWIKIVVVHKHKFFLEHQFSISELLFWKSKWKWLKVNKKFHENIPQILHSTAEG